MGQRKKVVDPHNARRPDYKKVIETIADRGHCPFCPENFHYHKKPILREEGDWLITENSWPYPDTAYHLVVICRTHKERFEELTSADYADLSALVQWAIQEYKIAGGGLCLRFGDTLYTGATVCHLHAHLIVPAIDPATGRATPVQFPIG